MYACMCMHVYVRLCMYACICMHVYVCICIYTSYINIYDTCAWTPNKESICIYMYVTICLHVYVCMYLYACICMTDWKLQHRFWGDGLETTI